MLNAYNVKNILCHAQRATKTAEVKIERVLSIEGSRWMARETSRGVMTMRELGSSQNYKGESTLDSRV